MTVDVGPTVNEIMAIEANAERRDRLESKILEIHVPAKVTCLEKYSSIIMYQGGDFSIVGFTANVMTLLILLMGLFNQHTAAC